MKYKIVFLGSFFILLMTYIANSIEISYLSELDTEFTTPENTLGSAWSMLQTFGKIMTFRLESVPPVLNLFLFVPISFVFGFIFISWIRGVD